MMFGFDTLHLVWLAPGLSLALWAQWRTHRAFSQGQVVAAARGITGAQAAAEVLQAAGVTGVAIEPVKGFLTDHYARRHKVLRLSPEVYYGRSLSALGVAAHEAGHALQDATRHPLLGLRDGLVPIASIGSSLSWLVILAGCTLMAVSSIWGKPVLLLGIGAFSVTVVSQLVNLPVEFDASKRARHTLVNSGIVTEEEDTVVQRVLTAAAVTYVAATLIAVLTLLSLVIRTALPGRSRDA
jgi:Zn-dependent membrane protease YugP